MTAAIFAVRNTAMRDGLPDATPNLGTRIDRLLQERHSPEYSHLGGQFQLQRTRSWRIYVSHSAPFETAVQGFGG